jgi:hypothetical protein
MRNAAGDSMNNKVFEFHIFVTSAPKDGKAVALAPVDDEIGFWGVPYPESKVAIEKTRADFDVMDLYRTMMNPPPQHQQLGDIHIWNGRPNWNQRFADVAKAHTGEVGVAFCGNPMVRAPILLSVVLCAVCLSANSIDSHPPLCPTDRSALTWLTCVTSGVTADRTAFSNFSTCWLGLRVVFVCVCLCCVAVLSLTLGVLRCVVR